MAEDKNMNEVIEVETNEEFDYDDYYEESSGGGIAKVVVGLVGSAVAAGVAAVAVKNRNKISDWKLKRKIKKLEANGYVVVNLDEVGIEIIEPEDEAKEESEK